MKLFWTYFLHPTIQIYHLHPHTLHKYRLFFDYLDYIHNFLQHNNTLPVVSILNNNQDNELQSQLHRALEHLVEYME